MPFLLHINVLRWCYWGALASSTAMRTPTTQIKNLIGLRQKNDKVEGKQSCCMCGTRLRRTILCSPLKKNAKLLHLHIWRQLEKSAIKLTFVTDLISFLTTTRLWLNLHIYRKGKMDSKLYSWQKMIFQCETLKASKCHTYTPPWVWNWPPSTDQGKATLLYHMTVLSPSNPTELPLRWNN